MVKLNIPGTPQGKARPRFSRTGHAYTPDETRRYEARVAVLGKYAMCNRDIMRGAVKISILAAFPVPVSYSLKRRAACLQGCERPAKKPDMDNIIKIICDGLNGIAWKDDAQVVEVSATKTYAEFPSVTVYIEELS